MDRSICSIRVQEVGKEAKLKVVSERLGHATASITLDVYSHVLPGMQQAAIERLDAALAAAAVGE